MSGNILFQRRLYVPIYNVCLWLVVARDAALAYRKSKRFPNTDEPSGHAVCCWNGKGEFGIFFPAHVVIDDVAHEIKHAADEIMRHIGGQATSEPGAYLVGYLTEWVHRKLKAGRIKL